VSRSAIADDHAIAQRDEVEATLDGPSTVDEVGPYTRRTVELVRSHAGPLRGLIARYDALVRQARSDPARAVLTHGEPHRANTMLTPDGWVLVDWDTALVAPPERDLWMLWDDDGVVADAYADATGVAPLPSMVDLYRVGWDLADIAVEVSRFRHPHGDTEDDAVTWRLLSAQVESLT